MAEEWIHDVEVRTMKITESEQQMDKKKKNESNHDPMEQYKVCQSIHDGDPNRKIQRKLEIKMFLKKLGLKTSQI